MTEGAVEETAALGTVESAVGLLLILELNLTCSKYNDRQSRLLKTNSEIKLFFKKILIRGFL